MREIQKFHKKEIKDWKSQANSLRKSYWSSLPLGHFSHSHLGSANCRPHLLPVGSLDKQASSIKVRIDIGNTLVLSTSLERLSREWHMNNDLIGAQPHLTLLLNKGIGRHKTAYFTVQLCVHSVAAPQPGLTTVGWNTCSTIYHRKVKRILEYFQPYHFFWISYHLIKWLLKVIKASTNKIF